MFFRWFVVLSCLLLANFSLGQTLSSSVDRNQLAENQTLTLTVTYDGRVRGDALDLSAIQQDFDIVRSGNRSFNQIINGQSSVSTSWELVLLPKRQGRLVIPSFKLGNIHSEAIQIQALEAGQASQGQDPITVELTLDRNEAKVGEQVIATVRLRVQDHITDLGGQALSAEGAEVQHIDQKEFSEIVNGINWHVREWTYVLFPQTSGPIAIPKQLFSGVIPSTQRQSFFESLSARGQRISGASEAASLNVTPALNDNGDWFPASDVSINSSWTSDPSTLRVGEPLTRIIEIKAESQLAAAIPPLAQPNEENYKAYLDQPSLEDTADNKGVTGTRIESAAIVPSKEGAIEFPEQVIRWWNINTNEWQEALLPAETYQVLPALVTETFSPPANFDSPSVANLGNNDSLGIEPTAGHTTTTPWYWKWSTIILLVLAMLQTAYIFMMRKNQAVDQRPEDILSPYSESEKSTWHEILEALKSEDAKNIRTSIINWSRARWPEDSLHTLDALAEKSQSEKLKNAFTQLEGILFKNYPSKPDTRSLLAELKQLREKATKVEKQTALAPLYPSSI